MKKILAIFLILAMVIPMGLVVQAEEPAKKPFTLVNWGDLPEGEKYTNVYYAPYYWTNGSKLAAGNPSAYAPALGASTIPDLVDATKELFDTYPDGARHINFTMVATAVHQLADVCFQEKVAPVVSGWLEEFLSEYKKAGGKLDGLIIDVEYLKIYSYYIHSEVYTKDPLVYDKIVKDPAYAEKIRPELEARGFKFYSPATPNTPEIYGISRNAPAEYAECRAIWDTVMQNYQAQVITDCCAPLWKYYPDATVSDYTAKDELPWVDGSTGGIRKTPGNASNLNYYSVRPSTSFFKNGNEPVYSTIKTHVDAVYENNAYNRFMYEANLGKNTYLASHNEKVTWWFAHAYYDQKSNPYVHTYYYAENVFHQNLLNPDANYGYILEQDCLSKDETDGTWHKDPEVYANALKIVDDCLRQISKVAGYADRKPIQVEANWNHDFVLSGMYAGGRNVWRITPDDNKTTLEGFKVKDAKDPTFKIGGETVTFPGGKIIEDDDVFSIGTFGYWVETPADVYPVITRVDDFYRNQPSYQETFDGFKEGTEYNYNNALPVACWENKKQGSSTAVVIADPANAANKVLEIKGGYNLKNVKLPKNIMAADEYAKHQAWEVTVTLPSDVAEDDELILLNAIPEKTNTKDKGIKIAGTKVFYDKAGELVELAGVTLAAGGKYTVIRDFDFTTKDAFTYDLYIYDAEGKVVAKEKKIPTAKLVLPVYAVGMDVKNPSGAAVLLDDYKLYPTKVVADFGAYNATTGIKLAEDSTGFDGNVAYRLSWLNATNKEKSYTLMAAYYDGDAKVSEEVVKEFKLAPNTDKVEFAVVENKQPGKKMMLFLKDNNPVEEEDEETPDVNNGTEEPAGLDSQMIIIIAAAAAVVVIVVVVIVIVASAKKKKKAAAATETIEETTEEKTEE